MATAAIWIIATNESAAKGNKHIVFFLVFLNPLGVSVLACVCVCMSAPLSVGGTDVFSCVGGAERCAHGGRVIFYIIFIYNYKNRNKVWRRLAPFLSLTGSARCRIFASGPCSPFWGQTFCAAPTAPSSRRPSCSVLADGCCSHSAKNTHRNKNDISHIIHNKSMRDQKNVTCRTRIKIVLNKI
jgi:hypothetical protein